MTREPISIEIQYKVFCRDYWHCRYCCDSVFFSPILKVLETMSPGHEYYHPNGKSGEMIPLFANKFASVAHIIPVTKGGENSIENYVTRLYVFSNASDNSHIVALILLERMIYTLISMSLFVHFQKY